jgi:hypothetical protein
MSYIVILKIEKTVKGFCGMCLSARSLLPLLGFWFGLVRQFLCSESCQIQSVKHQQKMVSNTNQHPPSPPSHTLFIMYTTPPPFSFTVVEIKYLDLVIGRGRGLNKGEG